MRVSNPIKFYIHKILHLQSFVSTKPSPIPNPTIDMVELKTFPLQFQTLDQYKNAGDIFSSTPNSNIEVRKLKTSLLQLQILVPCSRHLFSKYKS